MVSTGLSDVIGSWNTIVMRLPRIVRIVASSAPTRLRPSNHASPSTRPGGWRTRPISAITPTLLPLPDSPTIATVSPGRHVVAHPVDHVGDAALGAEAHAQVAHAEQRRRRRCR